MIQGVRQGLLVWVLVLVSGCTTPASPTDMPAPMPAPEASGGITGSIVDLTNAERGDAGMAALRVDNALMQAAQIQADQMARTGQMAHEIAGVRYPEPPDRLAAVGYRWSSFGENIAMGQTSAAAVMDSWMRSSGHRANILNSRYREIGVGVARDSAGRPYYVQVFAAPL